MIFRVTRNLSAKNVVKVIALLIPRVIFVPVYAWYKAYKDLTVIGKRFSVLDLRLRAARNKLLFYINLKNAP